VALVSCPECEREVSSHAKSCPHCGCPIDLDITRDAPGRPESHLPKCGECGAPATRACTRCGKMVCEQHITWFHNIRGAGAVCTACQGFGCIMTIVGLVIFGIIALVIFTMNK
jgi:hypothetical protein